MIVISNQLVDETNHQIIRELRCWYHIILLRYTYLNQWRWSNELTRATKKKTDRIEYEATYWFFFRRRKLLFKLKRLHNMRATRCRIKNLSHPQVKWRENLHISWAKNNLHEPRRPNFEQLKMPINPGYKLQPIPSTVTIQSLNQHQDEPFHPLSMPCSNIVRQTMCKGNSPSRW